MPLDINFWSPFNSGRLIIKPAPTIFLFSKLLISSIAANAVPPVAKRSSIIKTFVWSFKASEVQH